MIESFSFPVLSAIVFIPIVAAVIILFMDGKQRDLIRGVAISTTVTLLVLSALVYFGYNAEVSALTTAQDEIAADGGEASASEMFNRGLAFEEQYDWVPDLGISYHVGVDGLSAPMVLLTGMVAVAGVLISWRVEDRIREFMAFFLLLVAGVYGVFVAIDLFQLFFFYELAIFPMYLLIAGWGWVKLREYAAMKLTLYILIGSVVALVGAIAMVLQASHFFTANPDLLPQGMQAFSFDIKQLMLAGELGAFDMPFLGDITFAHFWFPFIFIGFAVLAGIFPFHNWSPDGHVAA
ncbi:MAG: hypothetical protein H7Y09_13375, partial [Chitinophagaceae bacterium]|nr:hypothetical protein [Anaerolineae bacterium]